MGNAGAVEFRADATVDVDTFLAGLGDNIDAYIEYVAGTGAIFMEYNR